MTDRALGDKGSCRVLVIGVWQMAFAAVLGGIATLCVGETSLSLNGEGWIAVWGLALISSAYGYTAQTIAQKACVRSASALSILWSPFFVRSWPFSFPRDYVPEGIVWRDLNFLEYHSLDAIRY